jgi:hypothetical protein
MQLSGTVMSFWDKILGRHRCPSLPQVQRYALNYEEVRTVGILFNSTDEDSHGALNFWVKILKQDGKKVRAMAYFEEKHSNPYDFKFDFFTKNDLKRGEAVHTEEVKAFMQERFDYLYCVSLQHFKPFDYIMRYSHAKCRIGAFYEDDTERPYELMIAIPEGQKRDVVSLTLQMMHYTKGLLVKNPPLSYFEPDAGLKDAKKQPSAS